MCCLFLHFNLLSQWLDIIYNFLKITIILRTRNNPFTHTHTHTCTNYDPILNFLNFLFNVVPFTVPRFSSIPNVYSGSQGGSSVHMLRSLITNFNLKTSCVKFNQILVLKQ